MTDSTQDLSGVGDIVAKLQSGTTSAGTQALDVGSLLGNMSMTTIIVSLIAGLVGSAYFMYGKKNQNLPMVFSGIALCIVPYFIVNTILLILASLIMTVLPFVIYPKE